MPQSHASSVIVVAAVQAAPVYMNLERSLTRALDLITEAARRRAQLVVFPESWLPGYPAWLDTCRDVAVWDHLPMKRLYAQLLENSVVVPSQTIEALGEAARKHNLTLVVGAHERQGGTIFNSILTFGPGGHLLNVHRKLVPTFNERLIWAQGDGGGLRVVETPVGRIGGLICWEHWMPLVRQRLHMEHEEIHVALWPAVKEMHQIASRHYAFEGRCFVVAAGGIMRRGDLPKELEVAASVASGDDDYILNGGSCVISPDGSYVAGPAFGSEVIILARINLERRREESLTLDVAGHFNRPDLFDFRFKAASAFEAISAELHAHHQPTEEMVVAHEARMGLVPQPQMTEQSVESDDEILLATGTEVLMPHDPPAPQFRIISSSKPSSRDTEIPGVEKRG
ncbi:MAG: carbon-nitrogen hydrolase family protein [Blastocatellia bacterium]